MGNSCFVANIVMGKMETIMQQQFKLYREFGIVMWIFAVINESKIEDTSSMLHSQHSIQ